MKNVNTSKIVYTALFAGAVLISIMLPMFLNTWADQITSAFTGILVTITAVYVISTRQQVEESKKQVGESRKQVEESRRTVEEMQKARQVDYIEKQLEMFYYPAKYALQEINKNFVVDCDDENWVDKVSEFYENAQYEIKLEYPEYIKIMKPIMNYQYLAIESTRIDLESYFTIIHGHKFSSGLDLSSLTSKLLKKINNDTKSLIVELNEIVN